MPRRAGALVAVALLLVVGCAPDAEHRHGTGAAGAPDRPVAGPQGAVAQFLAECGFSHAAQDDPIVHPGRPGASHLHVFFGNTEVDASTVAADLPGGRTTCDQQLDTASYWAPALLRDGRLVEPLGSTAYYRPGIGVDHTRVEAYPAGLVMVAGDPGAMTPQPVSVVAWGCGAGSIRVAEPPTCPAGATLRMIVTFPDCWDGERLDTADHRSHVAYSSAGRCPGSHPIHVPQLQFEIAYPVSGDPSGLVLASGGLLTGHADFMNGWDQAKLEAEVAGCLRRGLVCGVADGDP